MRDILLLPHLPGGLHPSRQRCGRPASTLSHRRLPRPSSCRGVDGPPSNPARREVPAKFGPYESAGPRIPDKPRGAMAGGFPGAVSGALVERTPASCEPERGDERRDGAEPASPASTVNDRITNPQGRVGPGPWAANRPPEADCRGVLPGSPCPARPTGERRSGGA